METRQPTLRIGRNVWDQINMPEIEFQHRVQKVKREMEKAGIHVLLIYNKAFNECANTCYISNYVIRLPRGTLVLLPKRDKVALFFEGSSRGLPFARTTTWVKNIRACGDVSQECAKYLQEKTLIPSTIGMVGLKQFMPYYQFKFLTEALSQCTIVDADHIIQDMKTVKSTRECDQIRRSSRIVRHIFDFITSTPFLNMNEKVFEAKIFREGRLEGAEDIRMLIGKPQEGQWALRLPEDTVIRPEQSVIIYLAVAFERYWAEGIRTFVIKNSSFVDPELEHITALYNRITDILKPGKTFSQCYRDVLAEIRKSNLDYVPEYGLGQGIGLSLREPPAINPKESHQLKKGMCLTLRLAVKDMAMGAVMVGNTFCVSENRVTSLTM